MKIWPSSLQGRLLAGLLAAAVAVWVGIAVVTWVDVRHELDELFDSHLAQAAALLVAQQSRAHDDDLAPVDAARLHRYAPRVAFQVWHEGRLAMRSAGAPEQPMVALAPPAPRPLERPIHRRGEHAHQSADRHEGGDDHELLDATGIGRGFHTVQVDGTAWRVFAAQGQERDVQVFVGEQLASRASILMAVLRSTALPMALALPLLALAIWWGVRQGTAPLRRLGTQLAGRDPRALAPVLMPDAPDEMQPMLTALNALFERITAMVEAERRFTADAAHELRTPIAAIRTQAQVALAETDDAARAHALRATLAGCDRATRLVEQLLTLSRLEGGATPAATPVDLSALAQRVAAELAPRAVARHQTLGLDAPAPCGVSGNETLLAVLLRNLLDNALRYSPDGAEVRIAVQRQGSEVLLQVDDGGPGLNEADLQRLGERFFRVLGNAQPGSGLGWSIVRRIADAHGARIEVARSAALGGLQVVARWKAAT